MYSGYVGSFHSTRTLEEMRKLIESLTATQYNVILTWLYRFSIESVSSDTVAEKIVLKTTPKKQLNSFTPRISISIWEAERGSNVLMEFEANPSIRTFSLFYDLACVVFQLIAVIPVIIYREALHFHHFIPICMMTAEHVFFPQCFDSSVKELWNELYIYLTGDDEENIPKLIKQSKHSRQGTDVGSLRR